MMYDDVATADENPFKGTLYNNPNGVNVYDHEAIDYRKGDVTAENFYAVLRGDSEATGGMPVLKTDSNSKVFVYVSDHGAPGIVQMPNHDAIFADKLQETIDFMEENGMYDELVFYIEACESGSMFPKLGKNQNVYAATATDAVQSSWAKYCTDEAIIDGVSLDTCLGDAFSVAWMEDAESHDPETETLDDQWEVMKA